MRASLVVSGNVGFLTLFVALAGCSSSTSPTSSGSDGGADSAAAGTPNPTPSSTDAGDDTGAPSSTTNEDASADSGTVTPTPVKPGPTPNPGPINWNSVVGAGGFFGQTFDGVTWQGHSVAPVTLFSVACADNVHGWTSGQGGFVAYTADGGKTWATQSSGLTADLHAINFGWSTHGVAAGEGGQMAVTQDSGSHWTSIAPLTSVALRGAAVAAYVNVMLVVGDGGTVLRSADLGQTWATTTIAGAGDLHGVASDAWAGTVLAVDSLGSIWSSGDEGVTWARAATAGASLDGVHTTQAGTRSLVVGAGGVAMMRSATGAWSSVSTGSGVDLHAALVTDDGSRLTVAGENGTLMTSADLGGHWTTISLGTSVAFYGLQDL